jgi:hypothetical protein
MGNTQNRFKDYKYNKIKNMDTKNNENNGNNDIEKNDIYDEFQVNIREFNIENLKIGIGNLEQYQLNQIKFIKKTIENSQAFGEIYYNKGRWWRKAYWITGILTAIVSGLSSIVNVLYDPCSNEELVQKYNTFFGFGITAVLGIITFLNASERSKNYEEAGDKYSTLANELFREVFYSNNKLNEMDLFMIIDKYNSKLDTYKNLYKYLILNYIYQ